MSENEFPEPVVIVSDRTCDTCNKLLPIGVFANVNGGPAYTTCKKCRTTEVDTLREEQVTSFAKRLAAEARGTHILSTHITELNAGMIKQFGGVEEFVKLWHKQFMLATVESPGSARVLRAFRDIVDLVRLSTEYRDSAPDVASLTDEELGQEMLKLAIKTMPKGARKIALESLPKEA